MKILGIETSCDETAAAVVEDGRTILSSVVASQEELHRPFGGVVPEIASRAHLQRIVGVIDRALEGARERISTVGAVAAVASPGLIGSLLVGLSEAKAIAWAARKPFVAVDHVAAHVYAAFLGDDSPPLPAAALVASGGHTSLFVVHAPSSIELVARTRDDAAGEAFDKAASMLGLGFPGGPAVEKAAAAGKPGRFEFPVSSFKDGSLDFSFSGIKTALLYLLFGQQGNRDSGLQVAESDIADILAGYQDAITEVLVARLVELARRRSLVSLIAGGGVCANRAFRQKLLARGRELALPVHLAPGKLCTDNAAMTAGLAWHYLREGKTSPWDTTASARSSLAGSRKQ